MRVIDLLNKIANGEEVPYGIMGGSIPYYYDKDRNDFVGGISNSSYFTCFSNIVEYLNLEVEVLEEDKEIEKITKRTNKVLKRELIYKINQLTDAVNELKKGN